MVGAPFIILGFSARLGNLKKILSLLTENVLLKILILKILCL